MNLTESLSGYLGLGLKLGTGLDARRILSDVVDVKEDSLQGQARLLVHFDNAQQTI